MLFYNKKAFSLLEIMVVIVIMAIITAIAVPQMTRLRDKAYLNRANELANKLNGAVSVYRSSVGPLDIASARDTSDEEEVLRHLQFDPRATPGARSFESSDVGRPFIGTDWNPLFGGNGTNLYRLIWESGQFIATNSLTANDGLIIDFNATDKFK